MITIEPIMAGIGNAILILGSISYSTVRPHLPQTLQLS